MTGYQEILTDPSYARQIVTLTYPHIGNTGTNPEDEESTAIHAAGLVIRDLPLLASNFRDEQSLGDYLAANNVVAIADIDTRRLTRILREKGAQNGCLMAGEIDRDAALAQARQFAGLEGMDLAREVTVSEPYDWRHGSWVLGEGYRDYADEDLPHHVVAYDFGVKRNILRHAGGPGVPSHRGARPDTRRRGARPGHRTGSSCPTAPATRSPATTPSPR